MIGPTPRIDPRIIRTRQALIAAFLSLAEQRDLADITISDITRQAGVNRKTFYLHYADKEALLADALERIYAELTAESRRFITTHRSLDPALRPEPIISFLQRLDEHPALYRRLIANKGSSQFEAGLQAIFYDHFLELWNTIALPISPDGPSPQFRAHAAAAAIAGVAAWWLSDPSEKSPEVTAQWLWRLIRPLWFDLSNWDHAPV